MFAVLPSPMEQVRALQGFAKATAEFRSLRVIAGNGQLATLHSEMHAVLCRLAAALFTHATPTLPVGAKCRACLVCARICPLSVVTSNDTFRSDRVFSDSLRVVEVPSIFSRGPFYSGVRYWRNCNQ